MSEETENNAQKELKIKVDTSGLAELIKCSESQRLEIEELKRQNLELLNKSKETGKGSIPNLNGSEGFQQPEIKKEFNDPLDMLFYLQKNDPKSYEIVKKKTQKGLMENKQAFEFSDKEFRDNKEAPSIIMRVVAENNKRLRANRGISEE